MKDLTILKPRELEAYFRELIRKTFNDKVENAAIVNASSGGNYHISILAEDHSYYEFNFKKKSAARIAKAIRALKA